MQRFSADIPWVLVQPWAGQQQGMLQVTCEVCGQGGIGDANGVAGFAHQHRVHQAPQGSMRLGDAVAAVAKPIARAMGMDPNCTPCEAKRRRLNALRFR